MKKIQQLNRNIRAVEPVKWIFQTLKDKQAIDELFDRIRLIAAGN